MDFATCLCLCLASLFLGWLLLVALLCLFCHHGGGEDIDLSAIRPATPAARHLYSDHADVSSEKFAEAGHPEERASLHD